MFGNKGLGWKLLGALALLAALAGACAWRGNSVNPAIWRCIARPDVWDGTPVRFQATVEEVTAGGLVCRTTMAIVTIRTDEDVLPGDVLEVKGVFHAETPHVQAIRIRKPAPDGGLRTLLNLVSILVLAAVAVNFLRHFAFRPQPLHAEGAD